MSLRRVRILVLMSAIFSALQCSTRSQALEDDQEQQKQVRSREYEKTFKPSDYDPDVEKILRELRHEDPVEEDTAPPRVTVRPDTVQGFRVQVLSTSDIEEANYLRDSVSVMLPNDWVYVVYQTPFYKVRIGDFHSRIDANRMSSFLQEHGFTDAWIVPDRVLKPPPPKVLLPKIPETQKIE